MTHKTPTSPLRFIVDVTLLAFPGRALRGCFQVGSREQQVIFGDLDGVLHVWAFGKHFHIPGGWWNEGRGGTPSLFRVAIILR